MSGGTALVPGQPAPDFTLRDQHGASVSLSSLRGGAVLLVFYPYAFSGVCTGELAELRENLPSLTAHGATPLGISCDPMFALRAFAERDRLEFSLLSDFWPHGEVARKYGVLDEDRGCATRSTFVVDAEGVLRWSVHNPMGEARPVAEYVRVLNRLAS